MEVITAIAVPLDSPVTIATLVLPTITPLNVLVWAGILRIVCYFLLLCAECYKTVKWTQTKANSWQADTLTYSQWNVLLEVGEVPLYAVTFSLVPYGTNTLFSDSRISPDVIFFFLFLNDFNNYYLKVNGPVNQFVFPSWVYTGINGTIAAYSTVSFGCILETCLQLKSK